MLILDINIKTQEVLEREFKLLIDRVDKYEKNVNNIGLTNFRDDSGKMIVRIDYFNYIEKLGSSKPNRFWMILVITLQYLFYFKVPVSNNVDFESLLEKHTIGTEPVITIIHYKTQYSF